MEAKMADENKKQEMSEAEMAKEWEKMINNPPGIESEIMIIQKLLLIRLLKKILLDLMKMLLIETKLQLNLQI